MFKVGDRVKLIGCQDSEAGWHKLSKEKFYVVREALKLNGKDSIGFKNDDDCNVVLYASRFELAPEVVAPFKTGDKVRLKKEYARRWVGTGKTNLAVVNGIVRNEFDGSWMVTLEGHGGVRDSECFELAEEPRVNTKVNLCITCKESFPECNATVEDIVFGDGKGFDNVQECDCYEKKESEPIAQEILEEMFAPEERKPPIQDTGNRTSFDTGAVRDIHTGKGRFDLLPWSAIRQVAIHCEHGAVKYGERNVDKGILIHSLLDSGSRHIADYMEGKSEENHLAAAAWNILWAMWMEQNKPDMQDIPNRKVGEGLYV